MSGSEINDALDYTRRLFDNHLDWYKNADIKAQIILTLDGAFLAFLTSSIFMKQDDLTKIIAQFRTDTWIFFVLLCFSLIGSIVCSLICLWSRISIPPTRGRDKFLTGSEIDIDKSETYGPQSMGFFQMISWLDPEQFKDRLGTVDQEFEIKILSYEIYALSHNVLQKHTWVNFGFILTGLSLVFFLAVSVSYVIRLI